MGRAVVSLALCALLAAPIAAQSETVATPVGTWKLSSDGGQCRAERTFETGGASHLVILDQNGPGPGFGLAVAGPSLTALSGANPIRLGFSEGEPFMEGPARIEPNRQYGKAVIVTGLAPYGPEGKTVARIDEDVLSRMDRVVVAQGETRVTFATGSLAEAARLLNACTAQTLISWGLDPEEQYRVTQPASSDGVKLAYPRMAAQYLRSGPVDAVVLIDASGTAMGCKILASSGYDELDKEVCRGMTKPRYRPARHADGTPVASFWQTRVNFNIPLSKP